MRNLGLLIMLFVFIGTSSLEVSAQKRTVAGVAFPAKSFVNGESLVYNGAGLREKYTFDLYVGALYLKRPSLDANKIINDDSEMGIHLELVSDKVTREKFVESVKEGFENSSHGKATQDQINMFMGFFKNEFKDGDKINIDYTPGKGVVIKVNRAKIGEIPGLDFKKAIFSIWLGTKPADKSLKKGMLGRL